jgi:hypothetical protein
MRNADCGIPNENRDRHSRPGSWSGTGAAGNLEKTSFPRLTSPRLRHGKRAGNPEKNGAQAPPPAYWPHPVVPAPDRRPGQAPLGIQKTTSFPRTRESTEPQAPNPKPNFTPQALRLPTPLAERFWRSTLPSSRGGPYHDGQPASARDSSRISMCCPRQ